MQFFSIVASVFALATAISAVPLDASLNERMYIISFSSIYLPSSRMSNLCGIEHK